MCGIAGIITKGRIEKGIIEAMTEAIAHRGPDGHGYYYCKNFVFGHRRLAIIDLSEAGHQPMEYMNRYVITYNGEIYNYLELRKELEQVGYRFQTHTDTEVIMASYDYWGVECLNKFNGMWAFVIYDKQKDTYFMSRDRLGKKPFYYYKNHDTFVFASEIKALLAHPLIKREPNTDFLCDYLRKGCREYVRETAFRGIYRLDPASYFEGGIDDLLYNFKPVKFWQINPNLEHEEFDEKKQESMQDSITNC